MLTDEATFEDWITQFKLDPFLKHWLLTSEDDKAQEWRKKLKDIRIFEMTQARKRQEYIHEHMKREAHLNNPKAKIRRIGIVDPIIKDDYESKYGLNCFHDPEFLKDTKKTAPELFMPD